MIVSPSGITVRLSTMSTTQLFSEKWQLSTFIHPYVLQWMHSFLLDRQQWVKIGNHYSDGITLAGGMPRGMWFGPYVFLILIDDLNTITATFKFVNDVTLTELLTNLT